MWRTMCLCSGNAHFFSWLCNLIEAIIWNFHLEFFRTHALYIIYNIWFANMCIPKRDVFVHSFVRSFGCYAGTHIVNTHWINCSYLLEMKTYLIRSIQEAQVRKMVQAVSRWAQLATDCVSRIAQHFTRQTSRVCVYVCRSVCLSAFLSLSLWMCTSSRSIFYFSLAPDRATKSMPHKMLCSTRRSS